MKRVVLDCLPFEDPANEARRIVRAGMADITDSFSEEVWDEWAAGAGPVIWGGDYAPKVDVLVDEGRGITFCSRAFDEQETRWEKLLQAKLAQMHFSQSAIARHGSWPTRVVLGGGSEA